MIGSKVRIIIFRIIIEPHLLISLLYAVLGGLMAFKQGFYSAPLFALTVIGAVGSQIAANTFDEYFDHRFGTDLLTTKTAYSGGGRIIFNGGLDPSDAFRVASVALVFSFFVGIYLSLRSGWELIPLFFLGGLAGTFYSTIWQRKGLGELMLCVIGLIVMGGYFVQAHYYSASSVYLSIPCGLLIANLVIMNEVPDAEADAKTGRKNVTTTLGRENAIRAYFLIATSIYAIILIGIASGLVIPLAAISLMSAPLIYSAYIYAKPGLASMDHLVKALRNNILGMYVFIVMLVIAYAI
ncbi:MAG: prenyltransferase [Methanomassiliicoccales archaeon]|nr:prenyltransferase [Methanomassiliicoccales archaeon]